MFVCIYRHGSTLSCVSQPHSSIVSALCSDPTSTIVIHLRSKCTLQLVIFLLVRAVSPTVISRIIPTLDTTGLHLDLRKAGELEISHPMVMQREEDRKLAVSIVCTIEQNVIALREPPIITSHSPAQSLVHTTLSPLLLVVPAQAHFLHRRESDDTQK